MDGRRLIPHGFKLRRLYLGLMLASLILILLPGTALAQFSDVPTSHTHYTGINWALANGITTGYADGTYRPNEPVTRGQMATFLHRNAGMLVAAGAYVEWTFGATPPALKASFNHVNGTTPTFNVLGIGRYELDFGFNLEDVNNPRFVQLTPARVLMTDPAAVGPIFANVELDGNKVRIWTWSLLSPDPQKLVPSSFYVLIY